MKNDLKDLEFLATKSKELIERQVASYRQHHSNSGIIMTVLALFIPFFLNGLGDSYLMIRILAIIPTGILIWAIILLIQVLRSRPLYQGANFKLIDELVNDSYENILLSEIGANKDSFNDNEQITAKYNSQYNFAIKLTLVAIVLSTLLLFSNQIFRPTNKKISKQIIMPDNKKKDEKKTTTPKLEPQKIRVIPVITQERRVTLNEGKKKK
ncbi:MULTISPECIES: hypothetical protein [unclassified Flavobacterium]|uniref:hypothetical protein n=1 Tax=unclassified Flavobacterium TaxID=196869 RepID=UPI0006ABBC9C|nr:MULTISPECIES: hypothetical protein [unclassified Flavobacterium]KOP38883.1 hypothetical protein AKO67_07630 [Flavobacterium sp. VMW]OWU92834.1 hypothetical protein APR43_01895 [Flavobacterium sp. NLM]